MWLERSVMSSRAQHAGIFNEPAAREPKSLVGVCPSWALLGISLFGPDFQKLYYYYFFNLGGNQHPLESTAVQFAPNTMPGGILAFFIYFFGLMIYHDICDRQWRSDGVAHILAFRQGFLQMNYGCQAALKHTCASGSIWWCSRVGVTVWGGGGGAQTVTH